MFVISSHKLFMELLKEEERKVLVEQMRKRSATINLSAKPLPSFYDIPGAAITLLLVHSGSPMALNSNKLKSANDLFVAGYLQQSCI